MAGYNDKQLLDIMRENERLRDLIIDATTPRIYGSANLIAIPRDAYDKMKEALSNKDSDD